MMKKYTIGIIGGMGDQRFMAKLEPLVANEKIESVYLFRYKGNVLSYYDKVKTLPLSRKGASPLGILPRPIFDFYNFFGFFVLCLFGKLDLLIGLYLYPHGFYASLLGTLFNIPFVLVLPGTDLKKYSETKKYNKLFKKASYLALRGSDSIERLKKLGFSEKRLFILHNVFKFTDYENIPKIRKEYDIVFTGFLRPLKRIDVLIRTIDLLKQSGHPDIKCIIVGDGNQKSELQNLVMKLDLEDNIIFQPYMQPIREVLYKSKIFVMTSESEGLPMSMIEAMACSLPVVISRINDIPDIVKHGKNGYLADPLSEKSFTMYLDLLLRDDVLRQKMGEEAYNNIQAMYDKEFSFASIKTKWDSILSSILN